MRKSNGYILSETAAVVVIATGFKRKSANAKTGPMLQVWILPRRTAPVKPGSTCGNCPLKSGACYVRWPQAPLSVWKAYKRGAYPHLPSYDLFAGRMVRIGAAGDPAFMPLEVIQSIVARCAGWTSYTHQWRAFPHLAPYAMASCDTPAQYAEARAKGFRTFRVIASESDELFPEERMCPSAKGVKCADCGKCCGSLAPIDLVIPAHGARKSLHPAMKSAV